MGAETLSQGSTEELAGSFLSQGEKGQGEAFTHDRWVPREDHGKKSKLSPALDIWKQNIYVANQSQMIKREIKGALMEKSGSSSDIFCVLCLTQMSRKNT